MEETKKKKKWPIIVTIIVVIGVIAAATSGGDSEPKKAETAQNSTETAKSDSKATDEKQKFAVGEAAVLNGVQVTLKNVEESNGTHIFTPGDGNVFVLCEFEIENNSKKEINVSSVVSFDAYCDDYATGLSLSALSAGSSDGKKQLDGSVAVGKKMNGYVGYEIPADWKNLEITYSPSFWNNKGMTFEAVK